jgi:hypothetical protein
MKTTMRKIVIAAVAIGFVALTSCEKHTCPTYSKGNVKQTEVKA